MIDTNTVNYTLNKLGEAYNKVAPSVQQISEKYVKYVVTQQGLDVVTITPILGVFLTSLVFGIWILLGNPKFAARWGNDNQFVIGLVLVLMGVICGGTFFCVFIVELKDFILAYTNPEIFAVEHLLKGGGE